jgi:hypothetical protein
LDIRSLHRLQLLRAVDGKRLTSQGLLGFVLLSVWHSRTTEDSLVENGSEDIGVSELCTGKVCAGEIGFTELSTAEVGTAEIGIDQLGIGEIGPAEARIDAVAASKSAVVEINFAEFGFTEVCANK